MKGTVLDLGRRGYDDVWALQKHLVEQRISESTGDTLVLVEHDHVITLGRKTSPTNFKAQSIPVFQVERGGDATYHGPGQLVGYPIVKLADHDVHRFLRSLEDMLIGATRDHGIDSGRKEGHTGVWVKDRKVASIGVAVNNWVTYHGFALNVNTDLTYFHLIRPCGLDPTAITSMQKELGREVDMDSVKTDVVRHFSSVFGEYVPSGTKESIRV
jgi:lipoate-protein ligase B